MMYQKYLILFNVLDYCYAKGANDDLPALLGEMSPNIFADSMPADMMVYEDWQVRCQNLFSWLEWKKGICDLLTHYEKEFHFCFDETKNILNELTEKEFEMLILGKEGNI